MKNSGNSNTKTTRLYHTIQKRKLLVLVTLFIILVLVSILAVGIGSVYIPPETFSRYLVTPFFLISLPPRTAAWQI